MTTTPRTASTSDARKRQAEKTRVQMDGCRFVPTADLPPVLPDDPSPEWHEVKPDHVVSLGERVRCEFNDELDTATELTVADDVARSVQAAFSRYGGSARSTTRFYSTTPPPVPREPWRDISTDRDQPTLATLTLDSGDHYTGLLYMEGRVARNAEADSWVATREAIVSVELLHTHDPVTHVPVERTLIDKLAAMYAHTTSAKTKGVRDFLAALADGAQS